ncbi:Hypothetical predicted protein [Paramuricea clavata]|uniref:Uncharacterized protein n=1 Tax=Paramuricea clavata TaxID=317549 RepID=A0A7D9KMV8_PARCT|nr:Hypothetical predicted protein [Paramuricea clavata]
MSERVLIQNPITKKWDESGIVLSERKHGGSYWIKTDNNWRTIRNRRFLKPIARKCEDKTENEPTQEKHETRITVSQNLRRSDRTNRNNVRRTRWKSDKEHT